MGAGLSRAFISSSNPREKVAGRLVMMLTAIVGVLLIAIYWYGTRTFSYWTQRGIKHDKPVFLFGNNTSGFLLRKSISQIAEEVYWKYPKEKVVGFYRALRPELVIRDPDLVKRVLVTDFYEFYARGLNPHKTVVEPLLQNLFFADGDLWRLLRLRMTGAFTSGKLRAMFPLIVERAERMLARVSQVARDGRPLDARELLARYTTDFIGACGFGLDSDSLNDDDSEIRKLGKKMFQISVRDVVLTILKELHPELFKNLRIFKRLQEDVENLVHQILVQRNYKPSGRNDFIDLMLECQKKGVMTAESLERFKADGTPEVASQELTEELIAAQVFVFFAAGFETSSSATSFTLHQLAFHPEVQRKAQAEIDAVLRRHDNRLSYDAVREMTYLSWCFKEGMRMFPSLGVLIRQTVRPYTFPELGLTVDEGVKVFIPVQALHTDPQYFDNPEEFHPERFDPNENDLDRIKYVYLPFGIGPRACIGERLGEMQSLAGLAALLSRFAVTPAPETCRHPLVDPASGLVQTVKNGIPLIFRRRELI